MLAKFFSFKNGVHIEDVVVNQWLNECRLKMCSGETYTSISSGDTHVSCHTIGETCIFIVAQSGGYHKYRCDISKIHKLEFDFKR